MHNQLINESEVVKTWAPVIEEATGINDKSKLSWMSKYCHFHQLNENVYNQVHLNPNMNLYGMGAVSFPGDPGLNTGFPTQASGSGDKPFSLLPLAMQVAAQTVGLDLVPVVPMSGPLGVLTYLDFIYQGGRLDSLETPLMVRIDGGNTTYTSGYAASSFAGNTVYYLRDSGGTTQYALTFIGLSRIDGWPIFKVNAWASSAQQPNGTAGAITLAAAVDGGDIYTAASAGTKIADLTAGAALLVKALEDHITSFSGQGLAGYGSSANNVTSNQPYLRQNGENTSDNLMGLSLFNKSVEAFTYQVAAAVTREQVQDLKQFGIDAVAQVEAVLVNELTQSINKLILARLFELGATNAEKVYGLDGTNLNLYVASTSTTASLALGNDWEGNAVSISTTSTVPTSGDNAGTLQRRILSKILASSNLIAIRGRRGAANFAVTNGQVASALQDIAGFITYPLANTINQAGGSLYPVGALAGVTIYVDPNMAWTDTRICVGRKGDGNSPGLVFMPYLMAESVQTIAEMTMAPKIAVKSRFALVDAGFFPFLYYFTMRVRFDNYQII
jgi:hypothetical protein